MGDISGEKNWGADISALIKWAEKLSKLKFRLLWIYLWFLVKGKISEISELCDIIVENTREIIKQNYLARPGRAKLNIPQYPLGRNDEDGGCVWSQFWDKEASLTQWNGMGFCVRGRVCCCLWSALKAIWCIAWHFARVGDQSV